MRASARARPLLHDLGNDLRVAEDSVLLHHRGVRQAKRARGSSDAATRQRPMHRDSGLHAGTHILANLDALATEARQQDLVALLDRDGHDLAVLARCTRASRKHESLRRRRRGRGRGQKDAAGGLLHSQKPKRGGEHGSATLRWAPHFFLRRAPTTALSCRSEQTYLDRLDPLDKHTVEQRRDGLDAPDGERHGARWTADGRRWSNTDTASALST